MKQISQNYKSGAIRLENVDSPALKSGGVLVQSAYSVISAGTEGMKVKEGKLSYLGKARARPDQVKKVLQSVQQQGLVSTYHKVMNRLDSLTPLGYSLSGIVIEVSSDVNEFTVGQRVAAAGAGYANHAEINFIPRNLVVPVPENVSMEHAAFTTIGAIAMQGFRQAEMQLGETACVIGLGLLGQILVQILRAAGVDVIGVDLVEARCHLAEQLGAYAAGAPDAPSLHNAIHTLTQGYGIDCVFLTAGGSSNGPVELAVEIARDRARVVDIGKTSLDLPWKDYYEKELDVRFSRSYGPGRYDPNYEERGVDYPIGYVRWTERRNMSSFLRLIADGKMQLDPIISEVRPFEEAEQVYEELAAGRGSGLGVVFHYSDKIENLKAVSTIHANGKHADVTPVNQSVRIGVIGAGNYASSMLLPHLAKNEHTELATVATASSLSGANAARKFGFANTTTDYHQILEDQSIHAVVIATRHKAHARMTSDALLANKTVFVEKPLAIDLEGLEQVRQAIVESGNDRLQVGFNRRFSPLVQQMAEQFRNMNTPLVMNYRVHAGQMDVGSWYLDPTEGTRFVGEAGHFLDVMAFLTGARPVSVMATALRPPNPTSDDLDNVTVIVTYDDGSVGTLMYLTQGAIKVPKEYLEVFGGGVTAQLHNFESLTIYEKTNKNTQKSRTINKGQPEEMAAFVEAIRSGGEMPISVDCLFDTTLVTLGAARSLNTGQPIQLADLWEPVEA